eukprot:CAMPEP_0170601484 /NCGR_PEP_ID=MMETSP0224-20130122/17884_1 /TAXON_ID=285029 /ORGANISM="Togula jolla, Strain CCCM 725" /LENGTH=53 /DNA_ID=CAMNT_0010926263 /DNA_START=191 /DNA_END=352 /DNA_ORIENTATION=-
MVDHVATSVVLRHHSALWAGPKARQALNPALEPDPETSLPGSVHAEHPIQLVA